MPHVLTIVLQAMAWLLFLTCTIVLGAWLRKNPTKRDAETASRILHFVFWLGVIPPAGFGFFYPGLTHFDRVLGLSPLPRKAGLFMVGALGVLMGVYLIIVSNIALRRLGEGANAFRLTRRVVVGDIYEHVRNPMSLGLYLGSVGIGLLVGSTYMTLAALLFVIPVHIFYLKYFEERELELRLGQSYMEYKRRVPFLLPRLLSRKS